MSGDDVIHLFNQIGTLENDVPGSLLEVAYLNIRVFENGCVLSTDMRIQPDGQIVAILRDGLTVQQIQHAV